MGQENGILRCYGLRNSIGSLDGVIGFFQRGEVMTAPIVGYDTTLPQALGLYRRLTAIALRRARSERLLFNMSAGAGSFKRHRGGTAAFEYTMVYNRHLPFSSRLACTTVRALLHIVGKPLLKSFAL